MPGLRRPLFVLAAAAGLLGSAVVPAAATVAQPAIVSANPSDVTPHALDGSVRAIVQSGSTIVAGGTFTQVRNAGTSAVLTRSKLFAFDRTTGRVTAFAPRLDGDVLTLAVAADGESVYVGGTFQTVNGVGARSLARIRISDGSLVPGFSAPVVDGAVADLKITPRGLFMGGTWTTIAGRAQPALAAVSPVTGAVDPTLDVVLSGAARSGSVQVASLDLTPDGRRMAVLGNFTQADGLPRNQMAMVDLGDVGSSAAVTSWATDRYATDCSPRTPMYVRELDVSPDGSYVVAVTTGGYKAGALCDTAARWEMGATGSGRQPTWVDYTGGDTLLSVTVTGTAVYIGGHQRWVNNPYAVDQAGPGAVERSGLAALDPRNGLPLTWNPGRTRGVGVFDMLATPDGLWAGSDTDSFGGEFHGRIAYFPLAGGRVIPPAMAKPLPGSVLVFGADASVTRRDCTSGLSCTSTLLTRQRPWDRSRGAFMLSGTLFWGQDDGTLHKRSYDGTAFGPDHIVDLHGLTSFSGELRSTTGMYARNGRLYYTVAGQPKLFYRAFTAESEVVGAERFEAAAADLPGLRWGDVRSSFMSANTLYAASAAGLSRIALSSSGVPTGSWARVSTPYTWTARGATVYSPRGYAGP